MTWYPEPSFAHLARLTDGTGLFEHARGSDPLPEHGYCVDDVARGLLVVCREPTPSAVGIQLAERYLEFLLRAQSADGSFHNRLGLDRRWRDSSDTGDWWGRAIWGLGTAAVYAPHTGMRDAALVSFARAAHQRSRWPRAMAFAGLGAAEVLGVDPEHQAARRLLADAATTVGRPGHAADWPWPEARLTYANAALAELHLAAGQRLGDPRAIEIGLRLLGWLLEVEVRDGHLSTTPAHGWARGEPRPAFDQQPIEAAAIADACVRAFSLTADARWSEGLRLAIGWFLGDNDSTVELIDPETGGASDGLGPTGRSLNQGAEATLALISTLQHGRNARLRTHVH